MKNKSNQKNSDVNNYDRQIEALHNKWKQFSKSDITDAIKKAGPDEKAIDDYLQSKAETTE